MAGNTLSYEVAGIDRLSKILDKIADATERLSGKLDKLDGKVARVVVAAETAAADKNIDVTDRKRRDLDGKEATVKVNAKVDKGFAETTVLVERFLGAMRSFALPAGILAAAPTLLEVAGAAVQMTGALGVIPAALAAGTVAGATFALTFGRVWAVVAGSDAEAKKAFNGLSESGRNLAGVIREVGRSAEWTQARTEIQNAAFQGLAEQVKPLANSYLPILRTQMTTTAGQIRIFIAEILGIARAQQTVSDVSTIFDNTNAALRELTPVGAYFVEILRDIGVVGSEFLPGLAAGFEECAESAAEFVSNARETGQLHDWISTGLSILGSLAQTLINLGVTFHNVWAAAGTDADGFMGKVRDVSRVIADWSGSVQGQQAIGQFFTQIRDIVSALLPLLGVLGAALFDSFTRIAPILPPIITGVTDILIAAQPLLTVIGQLATVVASGLGPALSFLAPILGPLVAALVAAQVATTAWAIAQGVAGAAMAAYNVAIRIAEVAQFAYAVATSAGTARLVLWAAAQWLVNAAMAANPIGLVVVAIAALVAGLVLAWNHSETFRAVVIAAWDGIKAAVAVAWEFLQSVFAAIPGALSATGGFFTGLWQGIVDGWNWLVTTVWEPLRQWVTVDLPGMWQGLVQVVTDVWNGIVFAVKLAVTILLTIVLAPLLLFINLVIPGGLETLKAVWVAIWDGLKNHLQSWWVFIQSVWMAVVAFVTVALPAAFNLFVSVATALWEGLKQTLQRWWVFIQSVWLAVTTFLAAVFTPAFQAFMAAVTAVWESLKAMLQGWWNVISALWNGIISYLSGIFSPGFHAMRDAVMAAWNALRDGISAVWNWIRDNIFNPIVNFVTQTIPNAFSTGVAAIRRAWDAVKAAMRDPIQAAINVVYNDGIVWVFNKVAETVNLSTRLPRYDLPGFARGGPITGGVPGRDSVPIAAMPGEYVLSKLAVDNAGGTSAIDHLHRALTGHRVGPPASDPFDDAVAFGDRVAYQGGGSVAGARASGSATAGAVSGSATATTTAGSFLGDIWDKATGFVTDLAGRITNAPWGQLTVGLGRKVIDMVVDWGKKTIADWLASFATMGSLGPGSQNFGTGQVAQMMAILHGPFPGLGLISGYRPGAVTAGSGNQSYHAVGRAVDIPPRMDVFNWIRANYMAKTRELIFSPANGLQVWNGQNHMYTGITRSNHFNHVHWAYANGGLITRPTFGLLGESGPEVVLPLSRPDRAADLAQRAGVTTSTGDFHVHVSTGPTASAEQIIRTAMFQARLQRMSGRAAGRRG